MKFRIFCIRIILVEKISQKSSISALLIVIIIFFFCGCIEPFDRDVFGGINSGPGSGINVELENLEEGQPQLLIDGLPIKNGETKTLSQTDTITISVANFAQFTSISWIYNNTELNTGNTFTITAGTPPFSLIKTYILTLETINENGVPGSSFIMIKID